MKDPYEVLGVERTASAEEIKHAYRKLSRLHHPDREGGDHERMAEITTAYRILSDPQKRAHYDASGEEKNFTAIEEQAMRMIADAFGAYLDVDGLFDQDPVAHIRQSINESIGTTEKKIDELHRGIRRIERKARKVRKKKGGEDLYANVVRMRVAGLQNQISAAKGYLDLARKGLELMDEYEHVPEPPEAAEDPARRYTHKRARRSIDEQLLAAIFRGTP